MKLELDENQPHELATALRGHGHDVHTVVEEHLAGERDPVIVAAATDEGRLLFTLDRGIGDLRRYPPGSHAGILVLRPVAQDPDSILASFNDSCEPIRLTTPWLRGRGRATQGQDPATRPGRSLVIPEDALDASRRWADRRVPEHTRDQVRLEVDVTDRTVTILECRPPWRAEYGPGWTRFPIARLRYTTSRNRWCLYWRDRNLEFHDYELAEPTPDIQDLLDQIDHDPTNIFWG